MMFKTWLRQYLNDDTPYGDLARDVVSDKQFPKNYPTTKESGERVDHFIIRNYLESCRACPECMTVFEETWHLYTHQEGKTVYGKDIQR